jgi:uncharacterized protein DUF6510
MSASPSSRLDGNAIAGTLFAVFGAEMTTAIGTCAGCGRRTMVGELAVYLRAPGVVVRCGHCDNVSMVLFQVRGYTCVDLSGLAALDPAEGPGGSG